MTTVNITLPDSLQSFVDQQASERGFDTCSEYISDLISRERDRQKLRELIMEGVNSPPAGVADAEYFNRLRERSSRRRRAVSGKPAIPSEPATRDIEAAAEHY
jgi:antitoxin ParD1/3/4